MMNDHEKDVSEMYHYNARGPDDFNETRTLTDFNQYELRTGIYRRITSSFRVAK